MTKLEELKLDKLERVAHPMSSEVEFLTLGQFSKERKEGSTMSKVSEIVRVLLHAAPSESAAQAFTRFTGDHEQEIRDYAAEIITVLGWTKLNGFDRRTVATQLIAAVASMLGVHLPQSLVNWLVEEVLAVVKSANADGTVPKPDGSAASLPAGPGPVPPPQG